VGTLYVVGTPIGNLEDITLRALRILGQVDLIAAEDTRAARKLLSHYDVKTPVTSYWEQNKLAKLAYMLETLQERDVALISRAGMPGISDPGYELIKAAIENGLPTDSFLYLGFLPRKRGKRTRLLSTFVGETRTLVAFEAPHRLLRTLKDIEETLGERTLAVTRELTKMHEEVVRGTTDEVIRHFESNPPRGEVTLVIQGAEASSWDQDRVERALRRLQKEDLSGSEAAKEVAKMSRRPRAEVYSIWLSMEDE
jgi:16S rRNA (cytidine1402-2'-O)-methyltransferase